MMKLGNLKDAPASWVRVLFICTSAITLVSTVGAQTEGESCIPPYQFVEIGGQDTGLQTDDYGITRPILGAYERISPDGRFILRSLSGAQLGDVALMELPAPSDALQAKIVRSYRTPLRNEAFPVQGSWRYLVNPSGQHYIFGDILQQQIRARPVFKGGITGFYAAAAELPADAQDKSAGGLMRIRSLSWPVGNERNAGVGTLSTQTITVDRRTHRILADTGRKMLCTKGGKGSGTQYALPMISVDGQEFSALPQSVDSSEMKMRIFGFGESGADCQLRETLEGVGGKTIFGFASNGQGGDLSYQAADRIWWYNRVLQKSFALNPPTNILGEEGISGEWIPSAFPGITQDGRIIYGVTFQQCTQEPCTQRVGYIIADPYQIPELRELLMRVRLRTPIPACITHASVDAARLRFAKMHGLK